MPRGFPQYPSHRQAFDYLRGYAAHFGLYSRIRFQETVRSIEYSAGQWQVQTDRNDCRRSYVGVIIASGHHRDPHWPTLPGQFDGPLIHAHDYLNSDILRNKRVLVIGGGNSGCDLAVEAAQWAKSATISMRRGYFVFPKYLFGAPLDRCGETMHRWGIKGWLFRCITRICLRVAVGSPARNGLPKPDHQVFESHPIVNSRFLDSVRQRLLQVRPTIENIDGKTVTFTDGHRQEVDLMICATGYNIRFPFLDAVAAAQGLDFSKLFLQMLDPTTIEGLYFIGLIQPNGGIWKLADYQSQLLAHLLKAKQAGASLQWFDELLRKDQQKGTSLGSAKYLDSPRHSIEVDYFKFRDEVLRVVHRFRSNGIDIASKQLSPSTCDSHEGLWSARQKAAIR